MSSASSSPWRALRRRRGIPGARCLLPACGLSSVFCTNVCGLAGATTTISQRVPSKELSTSQRSRVKTSRACACAARNSWAGAPRTASSSRRPPANGFYPPSSPSCSSSSIFFNHAAAAAASAAAAAAAAASASAAAGQPVGVQAEDATSGQTMVRARPMVSVLHGQQLQCPLLDRPISGVERRHVLHNTRAGFFDL